jgi:hypothetical protein
MVDAQGVRAQIAADFTVFVGGAQPASGVGVSDKLTVSGHRRLPN